MTVTDLSVSHPIEVDPDQFQLVVIDLYRDIHKGIRAELFDITSTAGRLDPSNRLDRADLAAHVSSVAEVLTLHAEHEDDAIDPVLEVHMPDLAAVINADHVSLEARFATLSDLSQTFVDAGAGDQRRLAHALHLGLSEFTSRYLNHQVLEELLVMPALERAIGPEAVLGVHTQIVTSIPPDVMAKSLAFMLPAMNVDDRTELLGGIRMSAPPEAFAGVLGLASSVLTPADYAALAHRLGAS